MKCSFWNGLFNKDVLLFCFREGVSARNRRCAFFPEKCVDPLVTWVFWGCSFVATKTWPISWKWYLRFWSEDCESISFNNSLTLSCLLTLTDFLYLLWRYLFIAHIPISSIILFLAPHLITSYSNMASLHPWEFVAFTLRGEGQIYTIHIRTSYAGRLRMIMYDIHSYICWIYII